MNLNMPTDTPSTYPPKSDEFEAFDAANSRQSATGEATANRPSDGQNNRNGDRFLTKLRSLPLYANVPVTMLTSRSGDKHRQLAMSLGATAYFSKPYQERALLESLKASLKEAVD